MSTKHWSSKEACDNYYKAEGFIVGEAVCEVCGFRQHGCVEPGLENKVAEYLECGRCGSMKAKFVPQSISPP